MADVIAEWLAGGRQVPSSATPAESESLLVNEVLLAYVDFAEKHYSDGQQVSTELANTKLALRPVKQLYGDTVADQFGPLALRGYPGSLSPDSPSRESCEKTPDSES